MAGATGGSHPSRLVRLQPPPAVLEWRTGEPHQPESDDFPDRPVPAIPGCRHAPWPAVGYHGHHTDYCRYPGDGRLRPARKPAVPVYDHGSTAATDEPRIRQSVRDSRGSAGEL